MSEIKKFCIILDTNVLGYYKEGSVKCNNFRYLTVSKNTFYSLINFVKENLLDGVEIAIPRIVIEELKFQEKLEYKEALQKLEKDFSKFGDLPDFKLFIPEPEGFNYSTYLDNTTNAFVKKYNIKILSYPSERVFKKLIEKVINRKKPFYKSKNSKDSGFKDAILWESILEYAKTKQDTNFILLSKDLDLNNDQLLNEFDKEIGKEIKIFSNLTDTKKNLLNKQEKLKSILQFFEREFKNKVRHTLYQFLGSNFYQISVGSGDFDIKTFYLSSKLYDVVKKEDKSYDLCISLSIVHETFYTQYAIVDEDFEPYQEAESGLSIILNVNKKKEKIIANHIQFEPFELLGDSNIKGMVMN